MADEKEGTDAHSPIPENTLMKKAAADEVYEDVGDDGLSYLSSVYHDDDEEAANDNEVAVAPASPFQHTAGDAGDLSPRQDIFNIGFLR